MRTNGARCVGSGVPGHRFEYGHTVVPGTESVIFAMRRVLQNTYSANGRCRYCASVRWHAKREDCTAKATAAFRTHRKAMVKKGFASAEDEADRVMRGSGLTPEFIAEMFRDARGQFCPGQCGELVDGVWIRHRITNFADLQFDWRDPSQPLTPENCGPLCATCNQQKGPKSWAEFMPTQHATRINIEQAIPFGPPPKQLAFEF